MEAAPVAEDFDLSAEMEDAQPDRDLTDNEVPNAAQYVLVFPFDASTVSGVCLC
jgi:hypothetical protein